MKNLIALLFLTVFVGKTDAGVIIIEGKYQNKNLFVQNYFGNSGVGFCAQEIKVNGKITTDETNSSAFEIDLAALQLKFGEKVTVEIIHKEGCLPKVLNADDLKPKPSFDVLVMNISETGLLKWTSKNESGALPYVIETFKWNKWIPVGEVAGIGTPENHEYSFQVIMHSGENKFRVKQKGNAGIPRYSKEISVNSNAQKPSFAVAKNKSIDFSNETAYEVYDAYGIVVKKGFGKNVGIDNLKKGTYYLCYDNLVTEFSK
jgi:hypothetical protein